MTSSYVVNLTDYVPPARYDSVQWTIAQFWYSPDNVAAYVQLGSQSLSPLDADPVYPATRNFTITNAPTAAGWLKVIFVDGVSGTAPTDPVQYPPSTGRGAASPTLLSARYGVRHHIRDGVPLLDPNPVPFNMVRLESLADQIAAIPVPVATTFQVRFDDVPTQRYLNAQVVPGTLTAYVDSDPAPIVPTSDVDVNGNFTLPDPPQESLLITYAWQYLSDGEVDSFVDEARQWLREFRDVEDIPDGLVPALIGFASYKALSALAVTAGRVTLIRGGDQEVDWSKLSAAWQKSAAAEYASACKLREAYYTQGPEALDPTVGEFAAPNIPVYGPVR